MAFDAASSYGHVLSPPMLANMESQHTFGYDGAHLSRTTTDPQDAASHPSSFRRQRRSRAASTASVPDSDAMTASASSSVRRHARLNSAGGLTANTAFNSRSHGSDQSASLENRMRNRSSPHLNALSTLSTLHTSASNRPLDSSSVPTSPRPGSVPSSGYFDPSHSEWAQHAAQMQQAAHIMGLHRLFASRSTPHLPDLDSAYGAHDFESPPPYAPQASATETGLSGTFQTLPALGLTSPEPPLPPPISIPRSDCRNGLTAARRPSRPGPSPRGSRSGPPSPSASFYGRHGLTSISPLPAGLGMTPNVVYTSQISAPSSPVMGQGSDGEEDRDEALTFSSTRSRERRDVRRKSVGSADGCQLPNAATSFPPASASRRRLRAESIGNAAQPLPHLPTNVSHQDNPIPTQERTRSRHASCGTSSANVSSNILPRGAAGSNDTSVESPSSPDFEGDESEPISPASASPTVPATELTPLNDASINDDQDEDGDDFPLVLRGILHTLRILAAVPGCIGTFWLMRNAVMLARVQSSLLSGGQTLMVADGTLVHPNKIGSFEMAGYTGAFRLGPQQPGALAFAVSCLWSMSTAYHALSFTTLLLRRWLLYYSILPSLIRLVALQAICWPLVRLTVHLFGPNQPLGAWVVIGTTTAISDVVSRWVTSNIADAPLEGEPEDEEDYSDNDAFDRAAGSSSGRNKPNAQGHRDDGESDWELRSGDESEAMAAVRERSERRRQRRGGQGTRFWRAVIGGPTTPSKRRKKHKSSSSYVSGTATETEVEADSDWPGYGTDRTFMASSTTGLLRHRRTASRSVALTVTAQRASNRTILPRTSSYSSTNRADSRRKFRWDVAMRRNVLPIAALGYLSMWILILDAMKLRA